MDIKLPKLAIYAAAPALVFGAVQLFNAGFNYGALQAKNEQIRQEYSHIIQVQDEDDTHDEGTAIVEDENSDFAPQWDIEKAFLKAAIPKKITDEVVKKEIVENMGLEEDVIDYIADTHSDQLIRLNDRVTHLKKEISDYKRKNWDYSDLETRLNQLSEKKDVYASFDEDIIAVSSFLDIFLQSKNIYPPALASAHMSQESSGDCRGDSGYAQGCMQFAPSTARKILGLKIDGHRSESMVPEVSIPKAASYMHDLFTRYHSISLALAAYNAGEPAVDNAIRKASSKFGIEKEYVQWKHLKSFLPKETQDYIPIILGRYTIMSQRLYSDEIKDKFETSYLGLLKQSTDVLIKGNFFKTCESNRTPLDICKKLNLGIKDFRDVPKGSHIRVLKDPQKSLAYNR